MTTNDNPLFAALAEQSDEQLHALIRRAEEVLTARKEQRTRSALDQIRRIAKEHGLDIAVKNPGRKRGRPPKAAAGG
ncbi:hypothetical protein GCM10011494_34400 [Novosphingobium endophyticum]|uniref:H-NS histone family protein n=1 Tax=Novosphingobium endophyticum TaxID=1955250 RepID=A0A916TUW4_9SPHN|nr:H-NS histone family protein [Novosphingobium endophyticum]GGC12678.1 hypothetical protein GCM10011494_34400 [Novosphingobium endophyticum]